jgi:hypothetical protein
LFITLFGNELIFSQNSRQFKVKYSVINRRLPLFIESSDDRDGTITQHSDWMSSELALRYWLSGFSQCHAVTMLCAVIFHTHTHLLCYCILAGIMVLLLDITLRHYSCLMVLTAAIY